MSDSEEEDDDDDIPVEPPSDATDTPPQEEASESSDDEEAEQQREAEQEMLARKRASWVTAIMMVKEEVQTEKETVENKGRFAVQQDVEEQGPLVAKLLPTDLRRCLNSRPLFHGCDPDHLAAVLEEAPRWEIKPGQAVEFGDGDPLLIIEEGAVQVSVGPGSPTVLGPGTVWNTVGMLGLCHEAEPFRPRQFSGAKDPKPPPRKGAPYEVFERVYREPPAVFNDRGRREGRPPGLDAYAADDRMCYFNLCPNSAQRTAMPMKLDGWLAVHMSGAQPGQVPLLRPDQDPEAYPGGATIVPITWELIERVGITAGRAATDGGLSYKLSVNAMRHNREKLSNIWRTVMSRCSVVFPGAPPEIMWFISEESQCREVEPGQTVVKEGKNGEALVLIDEGEAIVEKAIHLDGEAKAITIGRLGPSAIIGDLGFVGTGMQRAATVRAKSTVEMITIPAYILLELMRHFPGITTGLGHKLKEIGTFIQNRVPSSTHTFTAMELFSDVGYSFLSELAANGERQVFVAGQVIINPRVETGSLYIVEQGVCVASTTDRGQFAEFQAGQCFGHRTLFGTSEARGSTVQVLTPVAVLMVLKSKVLGEALSRFYGIDHKDSPFKKDQIIPQRIFLRKCLSHLEVFSGSTHSFIEALLEKSSKCSYMPGQTLASEGGKDTRLVVIVGGQATAYTGKPLIQGEESAISSFGELAMLGAAHKHLLTVRAQTVCFTIEVARETFIASIEDFPDERKRFENFVVKAVEQGGAEVSLVDWPFLRNRAPPRMLHLLDLHAGRQTYKAGDLTLKDEPARSAAVLIISGEADIVDANDEIVDTLSHGWCFNEHLLLGVDCPDDGCFVVPRTTCEVQVLTLEVWRKVMADFPQEQDWIRDSIMRSTAERAARSLGMELNTPEILRMSQLFRTVSLDFLKAITQYMDPVIIMPNSELVTAGKFGDYCFFLLSGHAVVEDGTDDPPDLRPGSVYGEASVIGLNTVYFHTVTAKTLCALQKVRKRHVLETLHHFEEDKNRWAHILREAKMQGGQPIQVKLRRISAFKTSDFDFIEMLCVKAQDTFFGPGAPIIRVGESCFFGRTPFYILLAGKVAIENDLGVMQNLLGPGELIGEDGALGLTPMRMSCVRVFDTRCAHCVMITGKSLEAALNVYVEERDSFEELMGQRSEMNRQFVERRESWLRETALPALSKVSFFPKASMEFLHTLAACLVESTYKAEELVTSLGDEAEAMMVVLEGEVQGEGRHGEKMGRLCPGACLGEPISLGICSWRMASVRAVTDTRMLAISPSALDRACTQMDEATNSNMGKALARIRDARQEQVASGLPMTALNINASKDCKCVQAISLQASRCLLKAGALLSPLHSTDPNGCHYWILAKGRAVLETQRMEFTGASPDTDATSNWLNVMPISAGFLLLEALACEYNIRVRAVTACEAYRVRKFDFDTSVDAVPSAQEWLARWEMIEAEARQTLIFRAEAALGVVESVEMHHHDREIHLWRTRKELAVARASGKAASAWRPDAPHLSLSSSGCPSPSSSSAPSLLMSPIPPRFAVSVMSSTQMGRATDDDGARPACSPPIFNRHRSSPDLRRTTTGSGGGGKSRRGGDRDAKRHAADGSGLGGGRSSSSGSHAAAQPAGGTASPSGALKLPRLMATAPLTYSCPLLGSKTRVQN